MSVEHDSEDGTKTRQQVSTFPNFHLTATHIREKMLEFSPVVLPGTSLYQNRLLLLLALRVAR